MADLSQLSDEGLLKLLSASLAPARPTEDPGVLQSALIGVGHGLDSMAAGAKNAVRGVLGDKVTSGIDWIGNKLGMADSSNLEARQAPNDPGQIAYQGLQQQHPIATLIGDAAPQLATGNPLAMAGMAALDYGTPSERAARGGLAFAGGKLGEYAGKALGRVLGGPASEAMGNVSNPYGIPLTTGQATGNRTAQIAESVMANLPVSSGPMAAAKDRTYQAFNSKIADMIGAPSGTTALTPEVLGAAKNKAGGTIGDLAERTSMSLTPEFADAISAIRDRTANELTGEDAALVNRRIDWLLGKADSNAPAAANPLRGVPGVDPGKDDVITAIRKFGGINPGDEAVGSLAKANPFPPNATYGPVWRQPVVRGASSNTSAGHSLDTMADKLHQAGYIAERDPSLVMDKIADSTMSGPQYSAFFDHSAQDPLANAIQQLTEQLSIKNNAKVSAPLVADSGTIPGTIYKANDSVLGEMMKGNQGTVVNVLGDLRNAARDAMDKSISPQDAAAWQKARHDYFNVKQVGNAARTDPAGMNLSPSQLLTQVNLAQRNARFGAGNDLAKLAQWAKPTIGDSIPNSGTAQRLFMQKLLTSPVTALGSAAGAAYGADKLGASPAEGVLAALLLRGGSRALAGKPLSDFTKSVLTRGGQAGGLLGARTFPAYGGLLAQ